MWVYCMWRNIKNSFYNLVQKLQMFTITIMWITSKEAPSQFFFFSSINSKPILKFDIYNIRKKFNCWWLCFWTSSNGILLNRINFILRHNIWQWTPGVWNGRHFEWTPVHKVRALYYNNLNPNQYSKLYPKPYPNQYPKLYPNPYPNTNLYHNKVLSQYSALTTHKNSRNPAMLKMFI